MYRVMIIDDEQSARKLLRASIPWESLNMEVVGEAASGIEAINVIDEMRPDIAFVDISMPFMNGIEFTEVATQRYPKLIIIIMTAIDQFEYARKCVSLPVFEYMLKPIVRAEVTGVLQNVKKKLDATMETEADGTAENGPEMEQDTIAQIQKFIENNYVDSKINLASVAEQFGFSASYLSRKFKQETGKNFVEYLTECRMEKAMKLAETGKKMFLASSEVGIPDPNYFGRCFKKYAGMSYSDYIAAHMKV
ncbi:MAG: response regulator [Lachnospiraceae bacterium]|nr:response regulator [Lachnospiraceae bacterium]MBR3508759.1 response regulator [Lachnospiraceae bacterium]MBR4606799.1 response regulator [Lachnospiraceae bacterium]MBR6152012.1 response regulator [Lachnospiraceae bacterium]